MKVLSEHKISEIKRLRSLNKSYDYISKELKCSKSTISTILSTVKVPNKINKVPNSTISTIKKYSQKVIDFMNDIKNTFFDTEEKFKRFIETLERHFTFDNLVELEMLIKQ